MSFWQVFLTEFSTVRGAGKLAFIEQQASLLCKSRNDEALLRKQRDWGRLGVAAAWVAAELAEIPLGCWGTLGALSISFYFNLHCENCSWRPSWPP